MARRQTPATPQTPVLNADQIRARIKRLEGCIAELDAFKPQEVQKRYNITEVEVIEASIRDALQAAFGHGTPRFNSFKSAANLDQGPHVARMGGSLIQARTGRVPDYDAQEAHEARRYLAEGKQRSIELLKGAIRALEADLAEAGPGEIAVASDLPHPRKVFIVHGHDEGARESVARYLNKIGFEEVILHERANQGRTVIEKVEAHGDVGFAVVLLSPDDEGRVKGGQLQPRARQNVLLELGYFIGRLSRERVCTLKVGEIEIPSDWRGVIDEPFDSGGAWKQRLAKELEAAGYEIDWNRVMR